MEELSAPLQTVCRLFEQAKQQGEGSRFRDSEHFEALLANATVREQIPYLSKATIDSIPNNGLCRYRGMVQDTLDPQYYIGAFQRPDGSWRTTKYMDSLVEPIEAGAKQSIWERRPVYCVAVPGLSAWAATDMECASAGPASLSTTSAGIKRGRTSGEDSMECEEAGGTVTLQPATRQRVSEANKATTTPPPERHAGLQPQEGDCMVFVYDDAEGIKINDVVEFVGVLSRVPELATAAMDMDGPGGLWEEEMAARPPTSLVTRLHAILATRGVQTGALEPLPFKGDAERSSRLAQLRDATIALLAVPLGGDRLAAEYILLQLVSRIYVRQEGTCLGSLSLGLVSCPPAGGAVAADTFDVSSAPLSEIGEGLRACIAALTPQCLGLRVSVDQLNQGSWWPSRDYGSNRLRRGALQVAPHTHILLDETCLEAGQLTETGINNLKAVKEALEENNLYVDFSYYRMPFPLDAPMTVLSVSKSLLSDSLNATVPLQPVTSFGSQAVVEAALAAADLAPMRSYLAMVRHQEFGIDPHTGAWLEERLVAARRADRDADPATFHSWLTIARLLAISYGERGLSQSRWAEMQRMEHRRTSRARVDVINAFTG